MSVGPRKIQSNGGKRRRDRARTQRTSGASAPDVAAVGVAGTLPAVVLLDPEAACCGPAFSRATRAAAPKSTTPSRDRRKGLSRQGRQRRQSAARRDQAADGSSGTSPRFFARIGTVFGSYDYINWRLSGERAIEQNWALEAGFVDLKRTPSTTVRSRSRRSRAPPCRARSRRTNLSGAFQARAPRKAGLCRERRSSAARPA